MEGLDRFATGGRVKDEGRSLAPVLDLDPELVLEALAVPEQVDDDPVALAMTEVGIRGWHLLAPQSDLDVRASRASGLTAGGALARRSARRRCDLSAVAVRSCSASASRSRRRWRAISR